jgi:hypothetical protein
MTVPVIDASPIAQRIRRLIGRPKTKADVAEKRWSLCPKEIANSPAAIFFEDELGRITGYQEDTGPELEAIRIRGGRREHMGTVVYCLRDATVIGGQIFKGPVRLDFMGKRRTLCALGAPARIGEAVLACTPYGNRFFGHFITDDIPLNLLGARLAEPITVVRPLYAHEPGYRTLTGAHARPLAHARCDALLVVDDLGLNRFKRERFRAVRAALESRAQTRSARGVFVRRGRKGSARALVNEPEVERYLHSVGIETIDPDRCSAADFAASSLGVRMVVGVEGSQLAPGIFTLAEGGTVVALVPPYRFNNVFKDFTDCLGMRYALTVGREVASGFRVEIDDLARLLDRVEREPTPRG